MVKDELGRDQPEFFTARGAEAVYTDLVAASETDMLHWLKHAVFAKATMKERGDLSDIDNKSVLIVKTPKMGIRRSCYVKTKSFLEEAQDYIVILGSPRSTGVKLRS